MSAYVVHPAARPAARPAALAAADARLLATRLLEAIPPEPAHLVAERRAVLASIGHRPAPQLALVVTAGTAVAVEDRPPVVCVCRGSGWVCEDHQWVPFAVDPHFACPCDGAGAPCRDCASPLRRLMPGRTPKEPTR